MHHNFYWVKVNMRGVRMSDTIRYCLCGSMPEKQLLPKIAVDACHIDEMHRLACRCGQSSHWAMSAREAIQLWNKSVSSDIDRIIKLAR